MILKKGEGRRRRREEGGKEGGGKEGGRGEAGRGVRKGRREGGRERGGRNNRSSCCSDLLYTIGRIYRKKICSSENYEQNF